MKFYSFFSLFALFCRGFAEDESEDESIGTAVGSIVERQQWWNTLSANEKAKLTGLFDKEWFTNEIDEPTRIAYAHMAKGVYDVLSSGKDSNPNDNYQSFAPLLLRTSFHGAGTYTHATGTGGSNGGTIFNHAELADKQNGCISGGTDELYDLFHGHSMVSLADSVVIAGVVALDVMEFPRMDLVPVTGGRESIENIAHRDRLTGPDDDPMDRFTEQYNLTPMQTVALVGGAHNFGSAHAKCSGYQGQWTSSPLSWFGPGGSDPTFFPDLLREDWRWYKVCTYENSTVNYISIPDPFANGTIPEDSSSDEGGSDSDSEEDSDEGGKDSDENSSDSDDAGAEPKGCQILKSHKPRECQSQALRGCDFEDGVYRTDEFPCDINLLQMRLKSDFMLKAKSKNMAFSQEFTNDPALLAQEFGKAYHILTHNGLNRCGLSGHGCATDHTCKQMSNHVLSATCTHNNAVHNKTKCTDLSSINNEPDTDNRNTIYITLMSLILVFSTATTVLVLFLYKKVRNISDNKKITKDTTFNDNSA